MAETLKCTVSPTGAKIEKISWESSNKSIAIVNKNGKITGLKKGTATITIKSSLGVEDKCTVTVKANEVKMDIPTISQATPEYYNYKFPIHTSSSLPATGCGIVATTMILQYLTGDKSISVQTVATWADNNGHFNGKGSNGSLFDAAAQKWNVGNAIGVDTSDESSKTNAMKRVVEVLQNSQPVISYQLAGIFTQSGHFIVLSGITEDGKIYVNNPSDGSQGTYTQEQISASNKGYYIFNAKK